MHFPRRIQDLSPEDARLCLGIERFVRDEAGYEPKGRHLLLALSGGPDSTSLVFVIRALAARWEARLSAAHLDHGLRPGSGREADRVTDLCAQLDLPLETGRIEVRAWAQARGKGVEEAARILRYKFLEQARASAGADMILTGHHLNDLAEDVLMRLLRGTGWPGLSGMEALDHGRRLLRPLLLTPKNRLTALLSDHAISWLDDPSNMDSSLRRNRLRQAVIPVLEEENPSFLSSVAQLWRQGRVDKAYWEDLVAGSAPGTADGEAWLLQDSFLRTCPKALRLRIYKQFLDRLGPGQALSHTLQQVDRAFKDKRRGTAFQFPGNKQIFVTSDGLRFERT